MKIVDYEKRKNKELFKNFKSLKKINVKEIQNYIPIYNNFFNFKGNQEINLKHNYITKIEDGLMPESDDESVSDSEYDEFPEKIFDIEISQNGISSKKKGFLKLIPVIEPSKFLTGKYKLDDEEFYKLPDVEKVGHADFYDTNNVSYVDSFFSFLSSQLLNNYGFVNAIDFYGSFLSIIKDFRLDISEDIEYYIDSPFFMKNKNKLFKLEDDDINPTLVFEDTDVPLVFDELEPEEVEPVKMIEMTEIETKSESDSCSSTSSHTDELNEKNEDDSTNMEDFNVVFDRYLVQITCLEYCNDTLDTLILSDSLETEDEWLSCLFQIIMTLIVFQDTFSFTHNDLHTNNVMFIPTEEEFITYCYRGIYYKIPTFGRIFKIIDFGRSIYKVNGQLLCSNNFQPMGDAATQYNTEPYFNPKKPRIEPNYSFDLCRLACSIWDNMCQGDNLTGVPKIIDEWCKDDNGLNVLYKRNGEERYPNFKLYKMIARTVHNHTPHNQLSRPEFAKFIVEKTDAICLDSIPSFN